MIPMSDDRRLQQLSRSHSVRLDESTNLCLDVGALSARIDLHEPLWLREIKEKDKRPSIFDSFSFRNASAPPIIGTSIQRLPSPATKPPPTPPGLLGSAQDIRSTLQEARIDLLDFAVLEGAAGRNDLHSFLAAERIVNWGKRSSAELAKATQYALSLGAFGVAQQLAEMGERLYKNDPVIKRFARMLAPAKVLRTNLPPDPRVIQNHEWLKKHASEYKKRWVALENGNLLFSGDSITEVESKVRDLRGVLLMRIP
jgi:hypothetical protein